MKLEQIIIRNYRSIKDLTIPVKHNCLIFVGINESGKSNILKAIALLDKSSVVTFSDSDIRKSFDSEDEINTALIYYRFVLESNEKSIALKDVFTDPTKDFFFPIKMSAEDQKEIIENPSKKYRFYDKFIGECLKVIKFTIGGKREEYVEPYMPISEIAIKDNFIKVKEKPENVVAEFNTGDKIKLSVLYCFDPSKCTNYDAIKNLCIPLTKEILMEDIKFELYKYIEKNKPKVMYWKYDQKYLVTEPINIEEFSKNPDICIPLRNVFHLCNITNIRGAVEKAKRDMSSSRSLLKTLSAKATEHIQSIWKEYKNIKIDVFDNTKEFLFNVQDHETFFKMNERSDGFKAFASFLLTISAEVRTQKLDNMLLIIDEPDLSLHPSGIRFFRDELINISKNNNYVFLATHSVFMIDRNEIDRHLIVKKINGITEIEEINESNLAKEEVIRNALGSSKYDGILKQKNLLLEGLSDYLIIKYMNEFNKNNGKPYFNLENHGLCYARGVNYILPQVLLVVDSDVSYLALVDSDEQGKKEKKKLEDSFPGSTHKFKEMSDVFNGNKTKVTIEDIIPPEWMEEIFNNHLNSIVSNTKNIFYIKNTSKEKGIIDNWNGFVDRFDPKYKNHLKSGYKEKIPQLVRNKLKSHSIEEDGEFLDFNNLINFINKNI